jgi:hypothetical protein
MLQESRIEEKSWVTLTGLTGFTENTTRIGRHIGLLGTARVTRTDTLVGGQTGLLGTAGIIRTTTRVSRPTGLFRTARVTEMTARVSKQIGLLGSARVPETATRSCEILAGLWKIRLTRKAGLHRIWLTRKTGLWKIRLTWKIGLCKTRGAVNQKKEKVLLQAKGQLDAGAQGVLPRHKNAECKRCVKEGWPRKMKRKSRTIGLTVYGPYSEANMVGKWIAKEEGGSSGDSSGMKASRVTPTRGEDNSGLCGGNPELGNCNLESGDCHPESGNCIPKSSDSSLGKENDRQGEELVPMDVNMVFTIPTKFCAPIEDVAELSLGAEHAMFEKPQNPGAHMKPLFIRGHLDTTPIGHMLVDGGDPMEAKGIICKELTVGSKTVPTAFFVVDVKVCYNMLLGRNWIHANECVPSTLNQCII